VSRPSGRLGSFSRDPRWRAEIGSSRLSGAGAAPGTPDAVKLRGAAEVAKPRGDAERNSDPSAAPASRAQVNTAADPLDNLRWGLWMVRAPLAHDRQDGDRSVLVGVLDPDRATNAARRDDVASLNGTVSHRRFLYSCR